MFTSFVWANTKQERNCILIKPGMRHYSKEKVLGPAKPLWFVRNAGFMMEAGLLYQIA